MSYGPGKTEEKQNFLKNASRLQPGIGKGLQRHCQPKQPRNTTGVASTRPAHPLRSSTPIYRHPRPPSRTRNPPVIPDHDRGPATTHPSPPTTIANPQPIRHPRPRSGTCYHTSVTPDHHREPATHPSSPTLIGDPCTPHPRPQTPCRPRLQTRHPRPPFPVIPDPPQMSFRAKSRNLSRSCTIPTFPNGPPSAIPDHPPVISDPDREPATTHPSPPTTIANPQPIRHPRLRSGTCYYTSVTPDHHREPATHPSSPTTHPSSPTPIGDLPRHQKNRYSRATRQRAPTRSLFQNLHSTISSPFRRRLR